MNLVHSVTSKQVDSLPRYARHTRSSYARHQETISKIQATIKKKYPIIRSPNSKRIRFCLTPNAKLAGRTIYMIKNEETGRIYVGKATKLKSRLNKHSSDIFLSKAKVQGNLNKYTICQHEPNLYQDLNESPDAFSFSILREVGDDENINELEKEFIQTLDAQEKGYNKNSGAGGGDEVKIDENFKLPDDVPTTPKKMYNIRNLRAQLTPTAAKIKNVVYLIIDTLTGKRYVGCTVQKLSKRMSEHFHVTQNKNSRGYNRPLMQALREGKDDSNRFKIAILFQAKNLGQLRVAEAVMIKKEKKKNHTLFNGNQGLQIPAKKINFSMPNL